MKEELSIDPIKKGNNIAVDPFRLRAACKANPLIAQGIALGGHGA
jgi:hypothetical protein